MDDITLKLLQYSGSKILYSFNLKSRCHKDSCDLSVWESRIKYWQQNIKVPPSWNTKIMYSFQIITKTKDMQDY